MTDYFYYIFLNHSIVLPAITGMIRSKLLRSSYYPFLLLIWLGFLNETLSLIFIYSKGANAVNSNIYVLFEFLLLLYQFYQWSVEGAKRFVAVATAGLLFWIADNFIINSLTDNNSLFRSFYSFVILLYSIDRINNIIFLEKGNLLRNASFLICIVFLFYYGYKTFAEAINIFDLKFHDEFYRHLWVGLSIINCVSNVFYTIAILCIPKKEKFILLY